jgi:hypothetical protein
MVRPRFRCFAPVFPEKRLELKSLKGQTKAEELRDPSQEKLVQNLVLKILYKFKNSYGGTPEPQTPHDAPWLHGPSLKRESMQLGCILT